MVRLSLFFYSEMPVHAIFNMTCSFSFPATVHPRGEKQLDVTRIEPGWASTTSQRCFHFTMPSKVIWIRLYAQACCNKLSINLGTTNPQSIDLALKRRSCDVISTCTAWLAWKKWRSCDVIKTPSVQPWFVYVSGSAQPYSINFG